MSAKYTLTKKSKIYLSKKAYTSLDNLPAMPTGDAESNPDWVSIACEAKQLQFTAGQQSDVDVATFCSEEQETADGLPAPAEMTMSGNWNGDSEALEILDESYRTGEYYAIHIEFATGYGFRYLIRDRQPNWSAEVGGAVEASRSFRIKGLGTKVTPTTSGGDDTNP